MPETHWIITTSPGRPLSDITADLSRAGLRVGDVLAEIGVITAVGPAAAAAKVRGQPGIADIAPATQVDIGPPGSDKTW